MEEDKAIKGHMTIDQDRYFQIRIVSDVETSEMHAVLLGSLA